MSTLSYEDSKKLVFKGMILLGVITIAEVLFALLAKGHLIHGVSFDTGFGKYAYMLAMVSVSLYKAYFIVYEFMHMRYEVKGLALSVLLPVLLLVWAVIAFFQEGGSWGSRRQQILDKNEIKIEKVATPVEPKVEATLESAPPVTEEAK